MVTRRTPRAGGASTSSSLAGAPSSTARTPRGKGSGPARAAAAKAKTNQKNDDSKTTSPYFDKMAGKGKGRVRKPAKEDSDDELSDVPEPTGLTSESESDDDDDESGSGSGSGSGSDSDSDPASGDAFEPESESEHEEAVESDMDSDDLDAPAHKGKRKSTAFGHRTTPGNLDTSKRAKVATAPKNGKTKGKAIEVDDDSDIELEEGQKVIGRIHPAPKTGLVPPGQISANTLSFLECLMYPENNDRDWFRSHEPAFRMAEKEFKDFVQVLQVHLSEADTQLPIVPARDIVHRIYRDVRFSADKSPYKANFALSTSRSGRRGIWAGYHLYVQPGGSLIACGTWQPERDVLQRIRTRLLSDPDTLRQAISAPAFVKMFGPAKPHEKGHRQNIYGHPDMLKVAPKGVDRTHKDIDLLKLRSITVVKYFTDKEVLAPDFVDKAKAVVAVMAPFVHTLNDYIAPFAAADDSDDSDIEALDQ